MDIADILHPENDLERKIVFNPEFIIGCDYGEPRSGHPEGKVIFHIKEVLDNILKLARREYYSDLRLIGLIHDTFKFKVDASKPKIGKNHHAYLARQFTEQYISDSKVLEIIELHDEAYNSWCTGAKKGWQAGEERAMVLINRLKNVNGMDMYLDFYKCDNATGDKSIDNFNWFSELVRNS